MHMHKAVLKWGLNYRDSLTQHILPYTHTISVSVSQVCYLHWISASINFTWFTFCQWFCIPLCPHSHFRFCLHLCFPCSFPLLHRILYATSWSSRPSVNFSFVPLSVNRIPSSSSNLPFNLHTGLTLVLTLSLIPRSLWKFDCAYL